MAPMSSNKKGQGALATTLIVLAVLAVIGGIIWATGALNIQQPGGDQDGVQVPSSCDTEPYLNPSVVDGQNTGTTLTDVNYTAIVNPESVNGNNVEGGTFIGDITTGSSGETFSAGDTVALLAQKSGYINEVETVEITDCGSNRVSFQLDQTSAPEVTIRNEDGDRTTDTSNTSTDGTVIENSSTSISVDVDFQSSGEESTSELVYVIEAANSSQVDGVNLASAGSESTPEVYSGQALNSRTSTFAISELVDGASETYTLTLEPASGETIGDPNMAVYSTGYAKQWFADTDGSFTYGIENDDDNAEYEYSFTRDAVVQ